MKAGHQAPKNTSETTRQQSARNIEETLERRDSHKSASEESKVAVKTIQRTETVQLYAGIVAVLARPIILAKART